MVKFDEKTRSMWFRFSRWHRWVDRKTIGSVHLPGIYLLALNKRSNDPVKPNDQNIIYIGETCSKKGLVGRWKQFEKSAFRGKTGHSGGVSFYNRKKRIYKKTNLYVAAFPVQDENIALRNAYIRLMERKLLWDFIKKNGMGKLLNKE